MQNRFLSLGLWASLALLAVFSVTQTAAWQINAWSLAFARPALREGVEAVQVGEPPESHRRGAVWMAASTLKQGYTAQAVRWLTNGKDSLGQRSQLDWMVWGDLLYAEGNSEAAMNAWAHVGSWEFWTWKARSTASTGNLDRALLFYRTAYAIDPEKGTLPLATFLQDSHLAYPESENLLEESIARYPQAESRPLWMQKLGKALRLQGHWNEAEAVLRQKGREYGFTSQDYIELGWVYYEQGDNSGKALEAFEKAIVLDPMSGKGDYAKGLLYIQEQRYTDAAESLKHAVALNPEGRWWWLSWGNAVRDSRDVSRALEIYQDALVLFPDWAPIYFEISWAYRLLDRPSDAVQSIEKALVFVKSPNAGYYVRAGLIYEWIEEFDKAAEAYRQALKIEPDNVLAQQGLARLSMRQ